MWGINKGGSNLQFLLKLVPLEAMERVRFARNMKHVVRYLACEVTNVYCSKFQPSIIS
jgi:hypothetical protein